MCTLLISKFRLWMKRHNFWMREWRDGDVNTPKGTIIVICCYSKKGCTYTDNYNFNIQAIITYNSFMLCCRYNSFIQFCELMNRCLSAFCYSVFLSLQQYIVELLNSPLYYFFSSFFFHYNCACFCKNNSFFP